MAATGPARNDRRQTDYGFVSWRIDQGTSGNDGGFFQYTGTPCSGGSCPGWVEIDDNSLTGWIVAGSALYQQHTDRSIWQYAGTPCNGTSCPGWFELDDNPNTGNREIFAGQGTVYQLHESDASVWQYTGTPCNGTSCPGWVRLDDNTSTWNIVAGPANFYPNE
jgi:hypothetical protein